MCEAEKAEHGDQGLDPVRAIGLEVELLVIEKALAGGEPDMALAHVAFDDFGRRIAGIAERLREISTGVVEDVAAAPIDEFEHAEHGEAEAEAVFDRLVD